LWAAWTPTFTWIGTPPTSPTVSALWEKIGKTVFVKVYYSSTDSNAARIQYITLPVAGLAGSGKWTFSNYYYVEGNTPTTTDTFPSTYSDNGFIEFGTVPTSNDGFTIQFVITGFYEVA
jgi:hypothetical protein